MMILEIFEKFVMNESSYFFNEIFSFGTKFISAGSSVKVIIKEVIRPKVIIQPKSMIGFISLKINERNAIIVVKTVYNIGQNILLIVKVIKSKIFFQDYFLLIV